MKLAFEKLLSSLKNSISKTEDNNIEQEVLQLACEQQVEGFFVNSFDDGSKSVIVKNYAKQLFRYLSVNSILKLLNDNGISTLVIKGISVARFYPDYTQRRCSDTDVLVSRTDYKKIIRILKKRDFTIYKMRKEEHHLCVSHPQTGTIEFHYRLYDEIFDELWFGHVDTLQESPVDFQIDGMNMKTLGITDGFIFLFLHFVKHYLLEFVTLKWILDILFYVAANSDKLDRKRVNDVVEKLGYTTLLNTIFGVGVEYLGFDSNLFNNCEYSAEKVKILLNDIEFCSKKENREKLNGFFHLLNIEVEKVENYNDYIKYYNKLGIWSNIFSSRARLQHKYPVLVKHPLLLPAIWMYRLLKGFYNMLTGKRKMKDFTFTSPQISDDINNRLSVMKDLDII